MRMFCFLPLQVYLDALAYCLFKSLFSAKITRTGVYHFSFPGTQVLCLVFSSVIFALVIIWDAKRTKFSSKVLLN